MCIVAISFKALAVHMHISDGQTHSQPELLLFARLVPFCLFGWLLLS